MSRPPRAPSLELSKQIILVANTGREEGLPILLACVHVWGRWLGGRENAEEGRLCSKWLLRVFQIISGNLAQQTRTWALEESTLTSVPSSVSYWLCDLEQVTYLSMPQFLHKIVSLHSKAVVRINELTFAKYLKYHLPTTHTKILLDSKCYINISCYYHLHLLCANVYKSDICMFTLFFLFELILYRDPNLLSISAYIEIYVMTLI